MQKIFPMNPGTSATSERPTPLAVRQLTARDAPAFEALCAREPLRLLTPRMNIEKYGLENPTVRAWGAFAGAAPDAPMQGVLLRFGNIAIAVDSDGTCGPAFARVIDTDAGVAGVRGAVETVRALRDALRRYTPTDWEDSPFLCLTRPPACPPETLALARRARPDDLDKLAALYAGAGTMYRSRANVAAKLAETRVFVVEEPTTSRRMARIASCALLNVEGRDAGLIGGVYTLPEARGKGYASACTAALSLDLQRDGKLPCLFYENPVAGRVYRRLGFEDAGQWAVLYLSPHHAPIYERTGEH
ncbi:MAG TPA: GNAT family N-acetyltransferase [Chthonomonadaceae bacterium]|nr:GNAT family N-acetyltransferase [Chthonomonadaceae bacterium]